MQDEEWMNLERGGKKRKMSSSSESKGSSSAQVETGRALNLPSYGSNLPVELQGSSWEEGQPRKSRRTIKRKRFDDEIVDSGPGIILNKPTPNNQQQPSQQGLRVPSPGPPQTISTVVGNSSTVQASPLPPLDPTRVSPPKKKKKKKKKSSSGGRGREGGRNLGRWKPWDDYALILNTVRVRDLSLVWKGVSFSCHFTLGEVTERWSSLMYNPLISKLAMRAVRNLHPEVVTSIERKLLFSPQEEKLLLDIPIQSPHRPSDKPDPQKEEFAELLKKHPLEFHYSRTPIILLRHWQIMKQNFLLNEQAVHPLPKDNNILNFHDAEDSINDGELFEPKDQILDAELAASDRKCKMEIRHLEAEVNRWQVMVDKVNGKGPPDFDNQTLAVLRGRIVRYLMRSKEITLGRVSSDSSVDVDLKLEGPAWKVSRCQGRIKLRNSGEFFIYNEGKRSLFVDGRPVPRGNSCRLTNDTVLEIASLKFVFLINQDLIEAIRLEARKPYV